MINVVFDYDGVIDKSMDYQVRRFREFSGKDITLKDFQEAFAGNVFAGEIFKGVDPVEYAKFIFNEQSTRKYEEGIKENLESLSNIATLSICSSSDERNINAALNHNHMISLFDQVLGRETSANKVEKLETLKKTGDSYFITDTLGDIYDGKKAGYITVGITGGFHDREALMHGSPDYIIDSIGELRSLL